MSSPFDDLDEGLQEVIDETMGEDIHVLPMATGQYGAAADPTRVPKPCRAVISSAPHMARNDFPNARQATPLATSPREIWITRSNYAALGYDVGRDDEIAFSDRGDPAPKSKVAAIHVGDHGDVQIILAG
ncbi:hypothetical protein [Devosia ginsengisoli]|uniref:hypothetical protein n=1 Tax=Devosia ginsengisoli TaxID=400770 RepID=UPI0026EA2615|nr:hypothetical protein [Devosia ginsengisoli]MCR6673235.1 hypothetical protein [Devosia ginsengisoli]